MGYTVRKKSGRWYVQYETYPDGKRTAKTVAGEDLARLGIQDHMSIEDVKLIIKDVNRHERKTRWDAKRFRIQERMEADAVVTVKTLPRTFVSEFEDELHSYPNWKKLLSNWNRAKKLIATLNIPSDQWKRRKQAIYNYFEENRLSDAYAKKVIRVMNLWGDFYSQKTGTAFSILPTPKGHAKSRIRKKYESSRKVAKASEGLTEDLLRSIKQTMMPLQYNWLFISLWFGLRPNEMRNLDKAQLTYVTYDPDKKLYFLNIKQTKLSNLSDDLQWKIIPVLYPEQKAALELINSKSYDEPLPKTVRLHSKGNYKLYAGRKGFGPLMWDKGHDIVEVSSWLGHKSIDRTYADYMNWKKLKLRFVA
jgi:hypothetical protein